MPEYAYTKVSGKLKDFMGKVRKLGVPANVTTKWLESIGYKSSNDRSIIAVVRQIKFIDDVKNPTEKWNEYRGKNYKQVLADGIREGYKELYEVYPDAHNRTNTELENFFRTKLTAGEQVISATVATFKALCELADFSFDANIEAKSGKEYYESKSSESNALNEQVTGKEYHRFIPKLHIDIQIHISPDATTQQIEKIFESMAKHIYRIEE